MISDKICYIHDVEDGNETEFDPNKHQICLICGAKLYNLAKHGISFDRGDDTVVIEMLMKDDY